LILRANTLTTALAGCLIAVCLAGSRVMADDAILVIDDRSSGDYSSGAGSGWRLVTDTVMGGVSNGQLTVEEFNGRPCLRLHGEVRTENNGGFIQAALHLETMRVRDASDFDGVVIDIYGNGETYNLHLRQDGLWLPWQAFRASFTAPPEWQTHYLPFAQFQPHKTSASLKRDRLKRIGVVAIGRVFTADLCIGRIGYYRAQ
jgi:Complex I intermediate-associated protein 30 (CIA30)